MAFLSYEQQKLLLVMAKRKTITREDNNVYSSYKFKHAVMPLMRSRIPLVWCKYSDFDRRNHYMLTLDGMFFVSMLEEMINWTQ